MKIKIQQTTTKEVEIRLPYYSKGLCHFYKIVSETDAIQINVGSYLPGIQRAESFVKMAFDGDCFETTEDEFNQAYESMLHKLSE